MMSMRARQLESMVRRCLGVVNRLGAGGPGGRRSRRPHTPFGLQPLEQRVLFTAIAWTGGGDGTSWSDANNWSDGIPNSADTVTINAAAGVTINYTSAVPLVDQTVAGLTSTSPINFASGSLTVPTVSITGHNLIFSGGTLKGATITASGGAVVAPQAGGGTLDGDTINGTLDLSQVYDANIRVADSLVLNGTEMIGDAAGDTFGSMTFVDGATPVAQSFTGTGTTIVFGGNANNIIDNALSGSGATGTLTLGSTLTIRGDNGNIDEAASNNTTVNHGIIDADTSGGTFTFTSGNFENSGTLEATAGGQIKNNTITGNLNTVLVTGTGSSLTLAGTNYVNNDGLTVPTGTTLNLGGSLSTAGLGTVTNTGGTINLTGTVNNSSATLTLNATTGSWNFEGGAIDGGTVTETAGALLLATTSNGTLSGVTFNGTLDLNETYGATVTVKNGLVLNGSALLGNASGSTYGNLTFADPASPASPVAQSLSGAATLLLGENGNNVIDNASNGTGANGTLTFASTVTIHGENGNINNLQATATILNQGTITDDVSTGRFTFASTGTFNNGSTGTLGVSNGGSLVVGSIAGNINALAFGSGGGTITLNGTNYVNNKGITVSTLGVLNVGGTLTTADAGSVANSGGTVNLTGTLNNGSANINLNSAAGDWNLVGGTINGGAITETGGSLLLATASFGILNGVTINGNLDISRIYGAGVTILGGLVLNGMALVGNSSGTTYGGLTFGNLSNSAAQGLTGTGATIVFGENANNFINNDVAGGGAAATLTLGPTVIIDGNFGALTNQASTDTILNNGTINDNVSAGRITLNGGTFSNGSTGTIEASNGGSLVANAIAGNVNAVTFGTGGGTITLAGAGYVNNKGITVPTGATLNFGGSLSTAGVGTITNTGGTVNITGALNNASATLTLNATTGSWHLAGGTITGGTLTETGGAALEATTSAGTLNGLTINGNLDVSEIYGADLSVLGGLVLNGSALVGNSSGSTYGAITFGNGSIATAQSLTGTGATIVLGESANNVIVNDIAGSGATSTLTLGPTVTIHGDNGNINNETSTNTILSQGSIDADTAAGRITLTTGTFDDAGTLETSSGGIIVVNSALEITGQGRLLGAAAPGTGSGTIQVAGNLTGNTTNAAGYAPQQSVVFDGNGTAGSPQQLEAMSQDKGAVGAGYISNFAYGPISVTSGDDLELINLSDNAAGSGAEAVYTTSVTVPVGATLNLNGLHLYAATSSVAGTVTGGTITIAPLPAISSVSGDGQPIAPGENAPVSVNGTDFGSVAMPRASATVITHTFTITNNGTGTLDLSGGKIAINGEAGPDFSVTTEPAATVAPGASTSFTITFGAIHLGDRTATITISSNDAVNPALTFTVHGLATTDLFDEAYYLGEYPDVAANVGPGKAFASGYQHYIDFGQYEGRQPNAFFTESFYLARNPDVAAAVGPPGSGKPFTSGFEHFVLAGQMEGRTFNAFYSESFYLAHNPDVAADVGAPGSGKGFVSGFEHFMLFGQSEGRPFSMYFDEAAYLALNPDVATAVADGAFESGFEHFEIDGLSEHRPFTALYNETFYLQQNPDVATAVAAHGFASGYQHFIEFGFSEGRNYSPYFDGAYYLSANPDVAAAVNSGAFSSGLEHYALDGQYEGRVPVPAAAGGAQPTVGSLTASPSPVNPAAALTFTAGGLSDGSPGVPGIAEVQFWFTAAPATTLNTSTDALLGLGVEAINGNWVLSLKNLTGDGPGNYVLFARAEDTNGVFGPAVLRDVTLS